VRTKEGRKRSALLFGSVIAGVAVVILGEGVAGGNAGTKQMVVTALSILAGILLAIIAVAGDPALLYPGSHRIASAHQKQIKAVLKRYKCLFYCYLATITFAVVSTALDQVHRYAAFAHWFERITLGLGACVLVLSFGLPNAMTETQISRLDGEVERRKKEERDEAKSMPEHPF